jgi:hypothetical protein
LYRDYPGVGRFRRAEIEVQGWKRLGDLGGSPIFLSARPFLHVFSANPLIYTRSPSWRFVAQKDDVARAAFVQAAAHALHLDVESSMAQALLEFLVFSG